MTILALLAGLLASHFLPKLETVRDYRWLPAAVDQARKLGDATWLSTAATIVIPVAVAVIVGWLLELALGNLGLLLLGAMVVIYTLGPRDLDRDVKDALSDADPVVREVALEHLQLDPQASGPEASAAVLHAGLARWFGVIFWFAVLGPAGALLYRGARVVSRQTEMKPAEQRWLNRLLYILNWPVVGLMVLASAMMGDFDRTIQAWRDQDSPWQLGAAVLDEVCAALGAGDREFDEGLTDGWQLVWRMLGLWLALLSLLLLAGWLT